MEFEKKGEEKKQNLQTKTKLGPICAAFKQGFNFWRRPGYITLQFSYDIMKSKKKKRKTYV